MISEIVHLPLLNFIGKCEVEHLKWDYVQKNFEKIK